MESEEKLGMVWLADGSTYQRFGSATIEILPGGNVVSGADSTLVEAPSGRAGHGEGGQKHQLDRSKDVRRSS